MASLNCCGWEVLMPCGPSWMRTTLLPAMASWERLPLASNGTMALEAPWMIRVGTVILARLSRKSVCLKAVMQSRVGLTDTLSDRRSFSGPVSRR